MQFKSMIYVNHRIVLNFVMLLNVPQKGFCFYNNAVSPREKNTPYNIVIT